MAGAKFKSSNFMMERFMSARDTNPLGPKATQSKVGSIYR
jgi:hypothetical protein